MIEYFDKDNWIITDIVDFISYVIKINCLLYKFNAQIVVTSKHRIAFCKILWGVLQLCCKNNIFFYFLKRLIRSFLRFFFVYIKLCLYCHIKKNKFKDHITKRSENDHSIKILFITIIFGDRMSTFNILFYCKWWIFWVIIYLTNRIIERNNNINNYD